MARPFPHPDAGELARALGRQAETVCRRYLPAGRRKGRYWLVGDVRNAPGRSLFVRLIGPETGKGAAGHWTDAATGEHGDLLDLIRHACGLSRFPDILDEACRCLSLPVVDRGDRHRESLPPEPSGSPEAARRLFAKSHPIAGTLAETYLRSRGITALHDTAALRFHPRCLYREADGAPPVAWPALIAAVTATDGTLTGVQRCWLARDGSGKAPLGTPRRALGDLLGHAVRFGRVQDVMVAGEGVETMLALRTILPGLPVAAALSAAHLAAFCPPPALRRLYIARDDDPAGHGAAAALANRLQSARIEAVVLAPRAKDFNDDLLAMPPDVLRAALRVQLVPEDVARFVEPRR